MQSKYAIQNSVKESLDIVESNTIESIIAHVLARDHLTNSQKYTEYKKNTELFVTCVELCIGKHLALV